LQALKKINENKVLVTERVLMKAQLRKIARMMAGWPLIGRFVRIGVAVIRLPEFRAAYLDLNHRQHVFETEQLPALLQTVSDLNHRQHVFETEQLPTLLQTVSDLNHRQHVFETEQLPTLLQTVSDLNYRQLASDNDRDNLVKSVPVALRKITRDLIDIRGQLENVSHSMEQRVSETRGQLENVSHSMEQRVSETRGQLENVSHSVGYLLGRVEFVRRELMFEMRYGASRPAGDGDPIKAKTEILSPEKLAAARSERLRLNLGCGHVPLEGYLNVDRRTLPGVDIVAEADELPFEPGEVDEIFSAHLLEHFPQEQLKRGLLNYWRGLLKPGGGFRAVVPDADGMIKAYSSGEYPFQRIREVTFGGQDYDGDFHFNMLTPASLSELLSQAGFIEIKVVAENRENGGCKEFEISARRQEEARW
jgi:predicted SAM-dependent methyltransferase